MPSIRKNLLAVLAAVEAHPEADFNLARFHCGTQYCSAGLAACLPEMQEQGLVLNYYGRNNNVSTAEIRTHDFHNVCDSMFGMFSWRNVFCQRSAMNYDNPGMSDKSLALLRLQSQLLLYAEDTEHMEQCQANTTPERLEFESDLTESRNNSEF